MNRFQDKTLYGDPHSTLKESLHSTQSISGRASILTYANKQYPSATDALQAYINNFENQHPSNLYKRRVEDLLSPKSVLLQTVDRSLVTGVRDTQAEVQRYRIKQLIDESYQEIQRADSEQYKARQLIESAKYLQCLSSSDLSSLTPDATIERQRTESSLSTDTLLFQASRSSFENESSTRHTEGEASRSTSKHTRHHSHLLQSYRENSKQLKHLHADSGSAKHSGILKKRPCTENERAHREVSFTSKPHSKSSSYSEETKTGHFKSIFWTGDQNSHVERVQSMPRSTGYRETDVHRLSNSAGIPGHVPTKDDSVLSGGRFAPSWIGELDSSELSSVIPHSAKQKLYPQEQYQSSSVQDDIGNINNSGRRSTPSWHQGMSMADSQVSGEERSRTGRAPPSWIHDLDVSGLSSVIPKPRRSHDATEVQNVSSGSGRNYAPVTLATTGDHAAPALNYSDLTSDYSLTGKYSGYNRRPKIPLRSSAEINNLVRGSNARVKGPRHVLPAAPVLKRRLNSDISMSTDDLILAPSTGRRFPTSRSMEDLRGTLQRLENSAKNAAINDRQHAYGHKRGSPLRLKMKDKVAKIHSLANDSSKLHLSDLYNNTETTYNQRQQNLSMKDNGFGDQYRHDRWRGEEAISYNSHSKPYTWTTDITPTNGRTSSSEMCEQRVIDRAERILGSPLTRPFSSIQMASPNTEDVLDGDRSWEKTLPPYKHLQPIYDNKQSRRSHIIERFLEDCINSNDSSPRLTKGEQPGPVEALKNMLFTIQSVAVSTGLEDEADNNENKDGNIVSKSDDGRQDSGMTSDLQMQADEEEGSKSLKRAMEHLSRLKYLVALDSEPAPSQGTSNGIIE